MAIPENIEQLANDIRTKIYGRDVREALASGIEAAGSIANDADIRSQETETKQTNLEKKYDEQIANMSNENPNAAELVDAHVSGYDGQSYTTIGKRFDSVDAQLAEIVHIDAYGVLGDGTDETVKIEAAFQKAITENKILKLNKGKTYVFNKSGDINAPEIIGNGATLVVNQNTRFITKRVGNLNLQANLVWLNANIPDSSWFYYKGGSGCIFTHITINSNATTDGTQRTKVGIRVEDVTNVFMDSIVGNGLRMGIQALGYCNSLYFDKIKFTNTETGLHCKGSPTNVTGGNYIKNVFIDKFSLINTKDQQNNYQIHKGADGILLEKCDGVRVGSVYVERACERAFYNSCVNNIMVDQIDILDTMGFKFAGNLRYDLQLNNIAKNCTIGKIVARSTDYPEMHAFECYDCEDVNVDQVVLYGNGIAHCPIMTSRFIKDIKINNVFASDIKRSMFEYVHWGARPAIPELNIPEQTEADYLGLIDGLTINNFTGRNVNMIGYEVIRFVNYGSTMPEGEYRYKNIEISNVHVDNQNGLYDIFNEVTGTTNTTQCSGLIDIDDVVNLKIKDCEVKGFKGKLINGQPSCVPIYIGSNSRNVNVKHREYVRNTDVKKFVLPQLYLSPNSELILHGYLRTKNLSEVAKIRPNINPLDPVSTVDVSKDFTINGEMAFNGSNNGTYNIIGFDVTTFTLPVLIGKVEITNGRGEHAVFTINNLQSTLLKNGDTVFTNEVTEGKIALLKDPNYPRFYVRDKTSPTKYIIKYDLTVSAT